MDTQSYIAAFEAYQTTFRMIRPAIVMTDYEQAIRSAVRQTWPAADLRGCLFHFAQALYRKAKDLHLTTTPEMETVQMAMNLPYLPEPFIKHGMDYITSLLSTKNGQLFSEYLVRQWLNKSISVYGLKTRTNNFAESFNRDIMREIPEKHPKIWTFCLHLRNIVQSKWFDMAADLISPPLPSRKNVAKEHLVDVAQLEFEETQNVGSFLKKMHQVTSHVYTVTKDNENLARQVEKEFPEDDDVTETENSPASTRYSRKSGQR